VKRDKRFMVETHRCSAKHQRASFHETESSQTFLIQAIPVFADKLLFLYFQTQFVFWYCIWIWFAVRISI